MRFLKELSIGILLTIAFAVATHAAVTPTVILRLNIVNEDGTVLIDAMNGGGLVAGHYYNLHDDTGYNGTILINQITKYSAKGTIARTGWRARKEWYYTFIEAGSTAPLQKKAAKILTPMRKAPVAVMELDKDPLVGKEPEKDREQGKKSHVKVVELHPPRKTQVRSSKYAGAVLKPQEETIREEKSIDPAPAERRANDGEVPARQDLFDPYGSTGFTLFPSARVIGKDHIRSVYTFSYEKADSLSSFLLGGGATSTMFKSKKHTFAVGWGLSTNTEMSYSYSMVKDNMRLTFVPSSGSIVSGYDVKIIERKKHHALTIKRAIFGHGAGSHARGSLYIRGERVIMNGGDDDNVYAAGILDVPFWGGKALGTAIYGVDDFGGENIERIGAGLRVELSERLLGGIEWYRQTPGVDAAWINDRESTAYTAQYRIDRDYFFNVSYEDMHNYLWGALNEGSMRTVNFTLFHSQ